MTLDNNVISNNCATFNNDSGRSDFGSLGYSGGSPVPEPGTFALMSGLAAVFASSLAFKKAHTGRRCQAG